MLNWDLFTHPDPEQFSNTTPDNQKVALSMAWKNYMDKKDIWISFYEWKTQQAFLATFCKKQMENNHLSVLPKNPILAPLVSFPIQTISISYLGK